MSLQGSGSGLSVLYLEDSPSDVVLLRDALRHDAPEPVEVIDVGTLAEAVEALHRHRFDVTLVDLNLPDSAGLGTIEQLRTAAPDVPLIAVTSIADPAVARAVLRAGALDCVVKDLRQAARFPYAVHLAIERHRIQAELASQKQRTEESEARLQRVIAANADGIVVIDGRGIVRLANPAAEALFERPATTLLGSPFGFPLTGSDGQASAEIDFRRPDGTTGIAGMRATAVEWDGENAWLVALRDITERVRAESRLKHALAQVEAVVGGAPILLWALDRDGRFTLADGKLTGALVPELRPVVGQTIHQLYGATAEIVRLTERALAGQAVNGRVELGGRVIDTWCSPLSVDDQVRAGAIGVGIDVTETVQLEVQFRQAQRMEAVGRLAGGVAHDFNNLLTVIIGYTELALDHCANDSPIAAGINQIRRAADSAARLTGQLLAFSRRQAVQPRLLNLNVELTRIASILHRLIGEDIELELRLAPELALVMIDQGQVEQLVMNLAVNARDAMPDGGRLSIETANDVLTDGFVAGHHGAAPGPCVRLRVRDTGVGMDEFTARSVFEPFFTTKGPGKGTGLGLATVYGVVKQNGGSIWVDSEPGHGATFTIFLPRAEGADGDGDDRAGRPAPRGDETILVVEDQVGVRDTVAAALRRNGYRVMVAADGATALELSRTHVGPLHLLLTDVVMPAMNGRTLATAVMAERPALRVLYMSGYTGEMVGRHGILDQRIAFIQKPFTPDAICRKVRDVLDAATPPGV